MRQQAGQMPLHTLIAFVSASLLLAISPGPDNLFVLMQSAARGWKAGVVVTLGLCTGLIVHTAAVAFGVAILIRESAVAFTVLKLAGAAYLLWLAWGAWRAGPAQIGVSGVQSPSLRRMYLRGIAMNVSNPKVAIFFLAFLPQFVSPDAGPVAPQIFILGALFGLSSLTVFCGVALAAGAIRRRLIGSARAQSMLNRLAATVFAGLALRLVLSSR